MYEDILETMPNGCAVLDKNCRIVTLNQLFRDAFGNLSETLAPDRDFRECLKSFAEPDQDIGREIQTESLRFRIDHEGQLPIILTSKASKNGQYVIFVEQLDALTTAKQDAEQRRFEAVNDAIDAVDYPLVLFSPERRFVLANLAWYRMFEITGLQPVAGELGEDFFWKTVDSGYYVVPEGMTKEQLFKFGLDFIYSYGRDFPLATTDGKILLGSSHKTALGGFLLSYRDITEQRRTEEELIEQREIAHQNEKLSAMGELLAGVAHELNNPLSVVFGYSQMLQGKLDDPILSERVDLVCQSAERAAKIVRTFLSMARQRPTKVTGCSLNEIVTTALEVSSYSLKSNGTAVKINLATGDPYVKGDFDQLAQVFSNLIVNAGHAVQEMGDAGQIEVIGYHDADTECHHVEIRDNGHGMSPEVQRRIFEPFYTTKSAGEGTGIGLAFSHRIVGSHDGALAVQSEVGNGTQFIVKLNAHEPEHSRAQKRTGFAKLGQTVLVVDDEVGIVQLLTDLLTAEGLIVTATSSPLEALRIVEERSFDYVLSDFRMPDMTGDIFYRTMQAISSENAQRTGFITGDALSANVRDFFATSQRPYIEKPIIKEEVLELLDQLALEGDADE